MGKKKFYAVRYADNTGLIFNNYDDYQNGIKGFSNSSSKGFNRIEDASEWLEGVPHKVVKSKKPQTSDKAPEQIKKNKRSQYYAVVRGRVVGVFDNKEDYKKSLLGYKSGKGKGIFKTKEAAQNWLVQNGISPVNKKGLYAVSKGFNTGFFTKLHTYEKNLIGYPGAKGRCDFNNKKEALDWINAQKPKKRYYAVAKGRRRGIYTDIKKYNKYISGVSDIKAKGGFKTRERAEQWMKEVQENQVKEYFAIAIGKRRGIYVDRKKYLDNLNGVKNGWGKDGFRTRADAEKWLSERLEFINKYKKSIYKEVIIAYESKDLPVIYTDGSYMPVKQQYSSSVVISEGVGSIAAFAKSNKQDKNNTLGELEGLLHALKIVNALYEFKEFILVYDYNDLEKIARGILTIKSVPISLQREIVDLIKDNELDIHFLNVKSHTGIVGNSVADRIARDISNHLNKLDLLRDLSFLN
ncbi:ribonuclease H family protein [Enterococcus sp. OL5]|uniref:ribonuclease H family protein n=1 Tax=Enterococcus sp. OL5 TaxID=2590214 RepID=UPI0011298FFD|nr:ribonuclease H family protein [Enterococcus sp. OL5]TPR56906.1 hypothetical protein FJU10_11025 [Enterococcus sp. OL5]